MKLNKSMLLYTALAGIAAFVIDLLLYNALVDTWAHPPLIALLIAIEAIVVVATVFIVGQVSGHSEDVFFFLDGKGPILIALAIALVVVFLLGMGLEWIYDHNTQTITVTPTSYIFLLDESGSMAGNDPNLERYNAVNTYMSTLPAETHYAVYMFGSTAECARPMSPYSQGAFTADETVAQSVGGGTAIRAGLQRILADYRSGSFSSGGVYPRVILLSDGNSGDMRGLNSNEILRQYRNTGISISTVGMGSADKGLMERIAKSTGGSCVNISNAQELAQGFTTVATTTSSRDLFSQRDIVSSEFLYAVLRVLFLTLLGALIGVMKSAALAREDSIWLVIIVGAIGALVGGLCVELMTLFGAHHGFGMAFWCILVAITPSYMPLPRSAYKNQQMYGFRY